jgi:uncharacterized damage-inducible protein DinB
MDIAGHLCHIHGTRRWWISQIDAGRLEGTERLYTQVGEDWEPIRDLEVIQARLPESDHIVVAIAQEGAGRIGPYENSARFLAHMVFHEGWHVGAIFAALRINGQEIPDEWEDPNVWGQFRDAEV